MAGVSPGCQTLRWSILLSSTSGVYFGGGTPAGAPLLTPPSAGVALHVPPEQARLARIRVGVRVMK